MGISEPTKKKNYDCGHVENKNTRECPNPNPQSVRVTNSKLTHCTYLSVPSVSCKCIGWLKNNQPIHLLCNRLQKSCDYNNLAKELSDPLPKEWWKTGAAFIYAFFVLVFTTVMITIIHERVPDKSVNPPLPDKFFSYFGRVPWIFQITEFCGLILCGLWLVQLIFLKHRAIVGRRCFFLIGTLYLFRCITMYITTLPVPGKHIVCAPKLYNDWNGKMWRILQMIAGGGLNITGAHFMCGDYIYSGHTIMLILSYLFINEYCPPKMQLYPWFCFVLSTFGITGIVIGHEHYTIDVIIGYFVTTRTFWWYHGMVKTHVLYQVLHGIKGQDQDTAEVQSETHSRASREASAEVTLAEGPREAFTEGLSEDPFKVLTEISVERQSDAVVGQTSTAGPRQDQAVMPPAKVVSQTPADRPSEAAAQQASAKGPNDALAGKTPPEGLIGAPTKEVPTDRPSEDRAEAPIEDLAEGLIETATKLAPAEGPNQDLAKGLSHDPNEGQSEALAEKSSAEGLSQYWSKRPNQNKAEGPNQVQAEGFIEGPAQGLSEDLVVGPVDIVIERSSESTTEQETPQGPSQDQADGHSDAHITLPKGQREVCAEDADMEQPNHNPNLPRQNAAEDAPAERLNQHLAEVPNEVSTEVPSKAPTGGPSRAPSVEAPTNGPSENLTEGQSADLVEELYRVLDEWLHPKPSEHPWSACLNWIFNFLEGNVKMMVPIEFSCPVHICRTSSRQRRSMV